MSEAPVSSRRRSVGFLLRFVVLLIVFYLIVAFGPVNDAVIVPFTAGIASVSGKMLNALGERTEVVGTEIRSSSFGVNIENGCNGVETALLFGAAVLAFPARWSRRLLGLAAGFLAIQVLNLFRVITLFWIGLHRPALFNSSHTVIWQSVVVLFGVLLFLLWASRQRGLSAAASPSRGERSGRG
jgi:exosortase H (IPTLxxWG-CTERM-specific)